MYESVVNRAALMRVRHFRMKLHGVKLPHFIGHAGKRRGVIGRNYVEARRQHGDLVAVRHPHVEQTMTLGIYPILNALEQL